MNDECLVEQGGGDELRMYVDVISLLTETSDRISLGQTVGITGRHPSKIFFTCI